MRTLSLWGPVAAVMAAIFFASADADPMAPPGGLSDKAAHFIAYAALGASVIRALAGGRSARATASRVAAAFLIASLYGVSDEVHQMLVPNRSPEVLDVVADAAGSLVGAAGWAIVARLWRAFHAARRA